MNELPKQAHPFEPAWRVKCGPLTATGKGLLPPPIVKQRDLVDELLVFMGTWQLTIKPRLGQVWADSRLVLQVPPSRLAWFRRMEQEIGTHDPNHAAPRCLLYGAGLEGPWGRKGFCILADGSARWAEQL